MSTSDSVRFGHPVGATNRKIHDLLMADVRLETWCDIASAEDISSDRIHKILLLESGYRDYSQLTKNDLVGRIPKTVCNYLKLRLLFFQKFSMYNLHRYLGNSEAVKSGQSKSL